MSNSLNTYQSINKWNASVPDHDIATNSFESQPVGIGNFETKYFKDEEMMVDPDVNSTHQWMISHCDSSSSRSPESKLKIKTCKRAYSVSSEDSMDTNSTDTMASCTPACATYQMYLEKTICKLNARVTDVEGCVRLRDRTIMQIKNTMGEMEFEIDSLKGQAALEPNMRKESDESIKQISEIYQMRKELYQRATEVQENQEKLQAGYDQILVKKIELAKDNIQLRNDNNERHGEYKDYAMNRDNLTNDNTLLNSENEKLHTGHEETKKDHNDLRIRLATVQYQLSQFGEILKQEELRRKGLEGHIIDMDEQVFELKQENEGMKIAIETRDNKIKELRKAKEEPGAIEGDDTVFRKTPSFPKARNILKHRVSPKELNKISSIVVDGLCHSVRDMVDSEGSSQYGGTVSEWQCFRQPFPEDCH